jgi:hypothetical protein
MKTKIILPIFFLMILSLSLIVSADTCTETDDGLNIGTAGSVSIDQVLQNGATAHLSGTDYCFDSSINVADGTSALNVAQLFVQNGISLENLNKTSGAYLMETTCQSFTLNGTTTYSVAVSYKCPNGCSNGACIQEAQQQTINSSCEETDEGLNIGTKGSIAITQTLDNGASADISATDYCFDSPLEISDGTSASSIAQLFMQNGISLTDLNKTSGVYLMETTCRSHTLNGVKTYDVAVSYKCENGCSNGKCIEETQPQQTINSSCTETDDGLNIGTAGSISITQVLQNGASADISGSDYCFDASFNIADGTSQADVVQEAIQRGEQIQQTSSGTYLMETTCQSHTLNGVKTFSVAVSYKCPNGCANGVCVQETQNECETIGLRQEGKYCSPNKTLEDQKDTDSSCENDFECTSNLCINSQCVSGNLWAKFMRWLSNLFG